MKIVSFDPHEAYKWLMDNMDVNTGDAARHFLCAPETFRRCMVNAGYDWETIRKRRHTWQVESVKKCIEEHPDWSQVRICAEFDFSPERVSEICKMPEVGYVRHKRQSVYSVKSIYDEDNPIQSIAEIAKLAKNRGMSYGQYVAWLKMEEEN